MEIEGGVRARMGVEEKGGEGEERSDEQKVSYLEEIRNVVLVVAPFSTSPSPHAPVPPKCEPSGPPLPSPAAVRTLDAPMHISTRRLGRG